MNIDNLNLVELNALEVQEVEGGLWWGLVWYLAEAINNPVAHGKAFAAGYQQHSKNWD